MFAANMKKRLSEVGMSKHNDNALKDVLKKGLRNQFMDGLKQGTVAVCMVINEKASDTSKTIEERIDDIMKFCSVSTKKR